MAGTNGGRAGNGRPAWQRLTKAQRARFLDAIREGLNPQQAAELAQATPRAFRALRRFDPRFEADYEQARLEGRGPIVERLRATLLARAFDPEEASTRPLHMALVLYDDEYRRAHLSRIELTGRDGGPLEHVTSYDLGRLTDAQLDSLHALLAEATADSASTEHR